jgi:hypothetical protein
MQQLVDIQVALRGRDSCDLFNALSSVEDTGCHILPAGITVR